MATLKNHPGYWLRDDAAAAFDRMEDKHGFIGLNDAGRTEAQQQNLINRWNRGGAGNRPPYLYQPAMPASSSNHVRGGGLAFDTSDYRRVAQFAADFGFNHPYPGGDPVHFEFVGGGSGGSSSGNNTSAFTKNEVKIFQEKLLRMKHDLGPSGADGIVGVKTRLATMHEQKMAPINGYPGGKLTVDGVPGWATNAYLDWWLTGPGKPQGQSEADKVKQYQTALNKHKYNLAVDGVRGHNTIIATMDFQKKNGLTADGIVGPATRAKLGI